MATKKSVFLSDKTVSWIDITSSSSSKKTGPEWSVAINRSIAQLWFLLSESVPDFSGNEWAEIISCYNHTAFSERLSKPRIASDLMDKYGCIDIDDLSPELQNLVRKLHDLTPLEQFAALYIVQICLLREVSNKCNDFDQILEVIKSEFKKQ